MPAASNVAQAETEIVHRSVRLLPGSRVPVQQLAGTTGACRFVWNHFLARLRPLTSDLTDVSLAVFGCIVVVSLGTLLLLLSRAVPGVAFPAPERLGEVCQLPPARGRWQDFRQFTGVVRNTGGERCRRCCEGYLGGAHRGR